ncbi:MAG: hypothetical protein WBI07_17445 [Mobilitalea sp.]
MKDSKNSSEKNEFPLPILYLIKLVILALFVVIGLLVGEDLPDLLFVAVGILLVNMIFDWFRYMKKSKNKEKE